jgi:hypothetical protein
MKKFFQELSYKINYKKMSFSCLLKKERLFKYLVEVFILLLLNKEISLIFYGLGELFQNNKVHLIKDNLDIIKIKIKSKKVF